MALEVPPPDALSAAPGTSKTSSIISLALLVISVGFAVAGQVTLKAAMDRIGRFGTAEVQAAGEYIGRAAREPRLWIGLFIFGISALFWLLVLSRVPLSIAYPLVGMSYVIVVGLARFVLDENVPALRWAGVVVVGIGIALIGVSSRSVSG